MWLSVGFIIDQADLNKFRAPVCCTLWHEFWIPLLLEKVNGLNRLSCRADCQEISRCCTRSEPEQSIINGQRKPQQGDPSWLWKSGLTSSEVQKSTSRPTKVTNVLQNVFVRKFTMPSILSSINWNNSSPWMQENKLSKLHKGFHIYSQDGCEICRFQSGNSLKRGYETISAHGLQWDQNSLRSLTRWMYIGN